MWILLTVIVAGPGAMLALVTAIAINDNSAESLSNAVWCYGILGLLLFVLGAVLLSDYRAWTKTRTIKLSIYENGIAFEENGKYTSCLWNEIKHLRWKEIRSSSRAFPGMMVKVIRSVVKTDGMVINFPETIDLINITHTITELRGSSS